MTVEKSSSSQAMDYGFVNINGERFVCINDLEAIPTFFVSMVSAQDHWFFAATNGSLSAGRGSPEHALFPYYTVDKIIDNVNCTGPQTIIKRANGIWEPFKSTSLRLHNICRKIYKSINGDTLIFEETHNDWDLKFSYTWSSSELYGFIRKSSLTNLSGEAQDLTVIDGLADILASGVDDKTHGSYSCLTDAYKVSELDTSKELLVHRMVASMVDEAIPLECLKATVVWSIGWESASILIRNSDIEEFLKDPTMECPEFVRGLRGLYCKAGNLHLGSESSQSWSIVADIDKTQAEFSQLNIALNNKESLWEAVEKDIQKGRKDLDQLILASDGLQVCSEEIVATYHRANVLFNIMRGGVFSENYNLKKSLLKSYIQKHNRSLAESDLTKIDSLPETFTHKDLVAICEDSSLSLKRICHEYLPLVFSRRHGDPSRPWNRFNIQTKDAAGNEIVGFQGNWRDIFQNWEALAWSFPQYNESFIRKFLNASTADGYNPYRITDKGIEWEEPDPDDPWASIGYWGDHQIIYLLKLLEFSVQIDKNSLNNLLHEDVFVFADVPYEIKDFADLELDPNHSLNFNQDRNKVIQQRFESIGADGKLVHDPKDQIVQANMLEKLLIPFLVKLSNYVPNGGIWMNTQRPEWNDANNALAGFGLSMVTTYYLHRYLDFLENLISEAKDFNCYSTLGNLLKRLTPIFELSPQALSQDGHACYQTIEQLGLAGEAYRKSIYQGSFGSREVFEIEELKSFLKHVRQHLAGSVEANLREDGLYNAYNILHINTQEKTASVETLGPMLEGQVAVLSAKAIDVDQATQLLKALKESPLYCPKRNSYILYKDRQLPFFLDYNKVDAQSAEAIDLLKGMIEADDTRIIEASPEGCFRFNASIRNQFELKDLLKALGQETKLKATIAKDESKLLALYESTFNHKAFTGRSGSMFAYEGLGSIYWHMVSKLMLAVQELALENVESDEFSSLVASYYDVQEGLGFRKKASDYGAFTADAYSHTPSFAGAQQPGLTGMVKEGVICRFAELGLQFKECQIIFRPKMLRAAELIDQATKVTYTTPKKEVFEIEVPAKALLFTIAQVPVLYLQSDSTEPKIEVAYQDGQKVSLEGDVLEASISQDVFARSSNILAIKVHQPKDRFID